MSLVVTAQRSRWFVQMRKRFDRRSCGGAGRRCCCRWNDMRGFERRRMRKCGVFDGLVCRRKRMRCLNRR